MEAICRIYSSQGCFHAHEEEWVDLIHTEIDGPIPEELLQHRIMMNQMRSGLNARDVHAYMTELDLKRSRSAPTSSVPMGRARDSVTSGVSSPAQDCFWGGGSHPSGLMVSCTITFGLVGWPRAPDTQSAAWSASLVPLGNERVQCDGGNDSQYMRRVGRNG